MMPDFLRNAFMGRDAARALVCKGKIMGIAIGMGIGAAIGVGMTCVMNACKCGCKDAGKKMKLYGNKMVDKVVDAAGSIKSTIDCDCDDNGAGRIPEEDDR